MDVRESFVEICGCRVLLRRAGTGQPVLFLHGAGGVPQWVPFFTRLAERFDLLVPDHPSYSRSETPDWLDGVGDLGFFYLDFLKELDLDGVHVIGHSLGGWVALEAAVRSTERIKTLTLIASAGIRIKGVPRPIYSSWTARSSPTRSTPIPGSPRRCSLTSRAPSRSTRS